MLASACMCLLLQAELAAAQSAAARVSKAIHDKDAQKKWMKF